MNNYQIEIAIVAILAIFATLILIPLVIKVSHRYGFICRPKDSFVDVPKKIRKKTHNYAIPVIGGVSVFVPYLLISVYLLLFENNLFLSNYEYSQFLLLLVFSALIFILGLLDDTKRLNYLTRLIAQIVIVLAYLYFSSDSLSIHYSFFNEIHINSNFGIAISAIWIILLINAINFIDGLDGLATGLIIIFLISLFVINLNSSLILSFSNLSIFIPLTIFLAYNFHPAKIFLGSSGTFFIGFIIGAFCLWRTGENQIIENFAYSIFAIAIPIVDFFVVCIERVAHAKNPCTSDSWHIHDRVVQKYISVKKSVIIIWLLGILIATNGILAYYNNKTYYLSIIGAVIISVGFAFIVQFKGSIAKRRIGKGVSK